MNATTPLKLSVVTFSSSQSLHQGGQPTLISAWRMSASLEERAGFRVGLALNGYLGPREHEYLVGAKFEQRLSSFYDKSLGASQSASEPRSPPLGERTQLVCRGVRLSVRELSRCAAGSASQGESSAGVLQSLPLGKRTQSVCRGVRLPGERTQPVCRGSASQ